MWECSKSGLTGTVLVGGPVRAACRVRLQSLHVNAIPTPSATRFRFPMTPPVADLTVSA